MLGVVTEAAQGHTAFNRLGLGRDQGIDAVALEAAIDLAIGVACIGRHHLDLAARGPPNLIHLALDRISLVGFSGPHLDVEDPAFQVAAATGSR